MSHRRTWELIVKRKIPMSIVMEDDVGDLSNDFDELYYKQFDLKINSQ